MVRNRKKEILKLMDIVFELGYEQGSDELEQQRRNQLYARLTKAYKPKK